MGSECSLRTSSCPVTRTLIEPARKTVHWPDVGTELFISHRPDLGQHLILDGCVHAVRPDIELRSDPINCLATSGLAKGHGETHGSPEKDRDSIDPVSLRLSALSSQRRVIYVDL